MKTLLIFSLIFSLFTVVACDDDSNTAASMTTEEFTAQLPALYCNADQRCCSTGDDYENSHFDNYDHCITQFSTYFLTDFDNPRVVVDESVLGEMFGLYQSMMSTECGEVPDAGVDQRGEELSEQLFTGLQAEGDDCESPNECAAGLDCDWDTEKCFVILAINETCTPGHCVEGTFCNEDDVCAANLVVGDACDDLDGDWPNCDGGDNLYCDENAETCKASLPTGSDCSSYNECQSWDCDLDTGKCIGDDYTNDGTFAGDMCSEAVEEQEEI
jgi:hypothetical protein